jgi:hypothetical protein
MAAIKNVNEATAKFLEIFDAVEKGDMTLTQAMVLNKSLANANSAQASLASRQRATGKYEPLAWYGEEGAEPLTLPQSKSRQISKQ